MKRSFVLPAAIVGTVFLVVAAVLVAALSQHGELLRPTVGSVKAAHESALMAVPGVSPVSSDEIPTMLGGYDVVTDVTGPIVAQPGGSAGSEPGSPGSAPGSDPGLGGPDGDDPLPPALAPPAPVDGQPDIRGTIVSLDVVKSCGVSPSPRLTLLVEGTSQAGNGFDKARVTVMDVTRVFVAAANGGSRVDYQALAVGQTVAITFTGAVAESYPVQATALEITITR